MTVAEWMSNEDIVGWW